jgi:hypothetical protein
MAKRRILPTWQAVGADLQPAWQWLAPRWRTAFWAAGIIAVLLLIGFGVLRAHAFWKWWSLEKSSPKDQPIIHPHADPSSRIRSATPLAGWRPR